MNLIEKVARRGWHECAQANEAPATREPDLEIEEALGEARALTARLNSKAAATPRLPTLVIAGGDQEEADELRQRFGEHYQIQTFSTAKDALAAITAASPDMAIIDIHLPDTRGLELLRQLKNVSSELPLILHDGCPQERANAGVQERAIQPYLKDTRGLCPETLENSARPANSIYEQVKTEITRNLIDDFKGRSHCRYSAVFDQNEARVLSPEEVSNMTFRRIARKRWLLPLCHLSEELTRMRSDANKAICPFHQDLDPREAPRRYNTGFLSSYRCGYYGYAASKRIDSKIIERLQDMIGLSPEPAERPAIERRRGALADFGLLAWLGGICRPVWGVSGCMPAWTIVISSCLLALNLLGCTITRK